MITAIDTNILLDILIPDELHSLESKRLLDKYVGKGQLIICEVVYAELSSQFSSEKGIEEFLSDTGIRLAHSNRETLSLAGERWKGYTRKRQRALWCPNCGRKISIVCPECNHRYTFRDRILSDFVIGAHALTQGEFFLSRDRGFYSTYFKELRIGN